MPHTISLAVSYRQKINSLQELPDDKRPPRNLWDKPSRLNEFLDEIFERKGKATQTQFIEYNAEDVE